MIIKIAEYTIKEGELDAAQACVEKFVRAVRTNEPETFYEAYRRDDSLECIHLMKFLSPDAETAHQTASYTKEFVTELYPRCSVEPSFTNIAEMQ